MRTSWLAAVVACIPLCGQITKQPEFDQRDRFRASQVEMAIDSDSHTSGMRGAMLNAMLNRFLQTTFGGSDRRLEDVRALLRKQDYMAASTALAGAPRKAPYQIASAVTAIGLGNPNGAVAPLCEAAREDDKVTMPFIGDLLEFNPGEGGCLRQHLAKAAKQSPDDAHVLYLYSLSLLRLDPPDQKLAEATLLRASQSPPKSAPVWLELGKLQAATGRDQEAIASLEQAVAIQPDMAQAHYRLAQMYRGAGKPELAATHLEAWRKYKDSK